MPHRFSSSLGSGVLRMVLFWTILGFSTAVPSFGQSTASPLAERLGTVTTAFTLSNGMDVIVVERYDAPTFAYFLHANVGASDERGSTGLAHLLEHVAFKGTTTIGATHLEAELEMMRAVDDAHDALLDERARGRWADSTRVAGLQQRFDSLRTAARSFGDGEAFKRLLRRHGAVDINATTSADATRYFYRMPVNMLELCFALESDRFLNPVLREFYLERDVVLEERMMRVDDRPSGRLLEELRAAAFRAHRYGHPSIGHASDLQSMTRREAEVFFQTHYTGPNLTLVLVGALDPDHVRPLAETYFGRLSSRPAPHPSRTVEPVQSGERRVAVEDNGPPLLAAGYHTGDLSPQDAAALSVLIEILNAPGTGVLFQRLGTTGLVEDAHGFAGYPGVRHPGLVVFQVAPLPGIPLHQVEAALYDALDAVGTTGVDDEDVQRARIRLRTRFLGELDSDLGLARHLAFAHAVSGRWQTLFDELAAVDAVTASDVRRVAASLFRPTNRTVAFTPDAPASASAR